MYQDYRAMKAANRAQVASIDGETVLRRQYFYRNGEQEPIREDVITVGYIAQELQKLLDAIDDLKAMGADFANAQEMTLAELRAVVAEATKGL